MDTTDSTATLQTTAPLTNTARLEVRLPPALLATLQAAATADDRDLSSWVRTRLERAARHEFQDAKIDAGVDALRRQIQDQRDRENHRGQD